MVSVDSHDSFARNFGEAMETGLGPLIILTIVSIGLAQRSVLHIRRMLHSESDSPLLVPIIFTTVVVILYILYSLYFGTRWIATIIKESRTVG
ncbi:hypothetical protein K461DRAFT_280325 [Myriangium duriaei CBS 260.36]|uniref:Uncharacterized protein n=1 Tax=Myriangium duriaei CBS 260.36 TaxID=1168546 RepID=A0A9P4IV96_9PEZI|nr:hypothetical protein K461DRAFT_280325 [Myriangium duriaei CBS 260.36]